MITDARVFQPEFIPREVVYRDAEINELSRALRPLIHNDPPETSFLSGPSGTGKTCLARYTLDRLHDYSVSPYVVILDEVDQLQDTSILYELYRTRGVLMVMIAND